MVWTYDLSIVSRLRYWLDHSFRWTEMFSKQSKFEDFFILCVTIISNYDTSMNYQIDFSYIISNDFDSNILKQNG